LRYEVLVDDYVPQPQLATCMWTITSPSIVQMHICYEIFKKFMQELKFRVPFC
jgi:hypothetical protein